MRRIVPILLLSSCIGTFAQSATEAADRAFDAKDYPKALAIYRPLADKGDAFAQWMLGRMYLEGLGVPKDPEQAQRLLRQAANQGNASLQFQLGTVYLGGSALTQNDSEAGTWFRKAAEQGHPEARKALRLLYTLDRMPQNPADEAKWFKLAAEEGDPEAQDRYGMMCLNGVGTPKHVADGLRWVREAALHGNDYSKMRLAYFYLEASFVKQDLVESYAWCLLADEAGIAKDPVTPAQLEPLLNKAQLAAGRKRAAALKQLAISQPAAKPAAH